ncbi:MULTISPECIES: sigma-70 family RNA polymerase sigma factor [unclassified Mucilaginibacter]|uniref:RNA polymerase sigma factor n=1 Tax=unclassified Mucilaginibacter TaxID=2617802 RepID=UPI0031F64370
MEIDEINFADTELWNLFRSGDELAYTKLMNKYTRLMYNYGYRFCQDADLIKDCVQEVFLELWKKRTRINSTPSVKWYLFKSLRLRIFRDQPGWQRNEELEDGYNFVVEFNIESQLIEASGLQEQSSKITAALNNLPPRQREILYLRFYEGLDFEQISELMGISRQSVHNLLQKAYKSFRAEWAIILLTAAVIFYN